LRLFSFGGYGLALAALALVVFGAIECPPFFLTFPHLLFFDLEFSQRRFHIRHSSSYKYVVVGDVRAVIHLSDPELDNDLRRGCLAPVAGWWDPA